MLIVVILWLQQAKTSSRTDFLMNKAHIEALVQLTSLQHLDIPISATDSAGDHYSALGNLNKLTSLTLRSAAVHYPAMSALRKMTDLKASDV